MSAETPEEYIAAQPPEGQAWVREFHDYVSTHYPSVPLIMFRGVPMFRFGDSYLKGYVMFTATQKEMSAHAIDFDLVDAAKATVGGSQPAKGCVKVKYTDEASKATVRQLVDAVMARHDIPRV
jgi:hypothetical protein